MSNIIGLIELVQQASAPGGIGPHEFNRPGGWRDRALATLASLGASTESAKLPVHYIGFFRREGMEITTTAYLTLWSDHDDASEAFKAFCSALTAWVDECETGLRLWEHSSEDLNIGDVISESVLEDPEFQVRLARHGIVSAAVQGGGVDHEVDYDHVLVEPMREVVDGRGS